MTRNKQKTGYNITGLLFTIAGLIGALTRDVSIGMMNIAIGMMFIALAAQQDRKSQHAETDQSKKLRMRDPNQSSDPT